MEKMAWDGPKCGREGLFPANPDLANILGDMDLDFENFNFLDSKFLEFQVPRFPKSGLGRAWGLGLGPWACAPQAETANDASVNIFRSFALRPSPESSYKSQGPLAHQGK